MADAEEVEPTDGSRAARSGGAGSSSGSHALGVENEALEPVGVGRVAGGSSTPVARERRLARAAKDTATAARDKPAKPERTTPAKFVRQSVGELRKVVYPTGSQLANYFVVVLVFVLFVIAYVSVLDLGLGWAIFKIFS